jgi:hypothetical protein
MSRTRLAAAAGVAALTLGATAAVAQTTDEQTVTITVTAAPRSITVGEPAEALTVVAGATATATTTSSLAYNAGPDAAAKITVQIDAEGNGLSGTSLTLGVAASGMSGDTGTGATVLLQEDSATGSDGAGNLVTGISADEVVTGKTVTYTLGGTAPSTTSSRTVDLTFTIANN